VQGVDAAVPISITGGNATYSINYGNYTNKVGSGESDDYVNVRVNASSEKNTTVTVAVTIGSRTATFSVTTGI